jgi:hypothetical protein
MWGCGWEDAALKMKAGVGVSGSLPQLDGDLVVGVEEEGERAMGQRGSTVGMVRAVDGGDGN